MELFKETDKLAAVIHKDHTLLPVINRFGLKLGFGDATIKQLCVINGIDVTFFLEIINVFRNENYFSEKKLLDFSVVIVIDYLRKTHKYYLDYVFPEQERLIDLFLQDCHDGCRENELVRKFYNKFRKEFINHVQIEEMQVFPYILKLNEAVSQPLDKDISFREYGNSNINNIEKEHSEMDEKMLDLKNIIIKYLPPIYDMNICNSLLASLFMFEKDLNNHSRIEDKILIPKVRLLEKMIGKDE